MSAAGTPAPGAAAEAPPGAWAPLRVPGFRGLWAAFLSAQVVVWMQSVGAVEVLNELHASSGQLALVQTATSLPTVLLALIAGTLADIIDRRRLLLVMQGWMFAIAALLCVLAAGDALTSGLVLLLTFALGIGVAVNTPAYQSLTPELVPRRLLAGAVSLNGAAVNLGRAVGPALGGLVVAVWSSSVLFGVEAAIVLFTAALVARLPARPHSGTQPVLLDLGRDRSHDVPQRGTLVLVADVLSEITAKRRAGQMVV